MPDLAELQGPSAPARIALDDDELELPTLAQPAGPRRAPVGKGTLPIGSAAALGSLADGGSGPDLADFGALGADAFGDQDLPAPALRAARPAAGPRPAPAADAWDAAVPDGGLDLPTIGGAGGASDLDFDLGMLSGDPLPALSSSPPPGGDADLPALAGSEALADLPAAARSPRPGARFGGDFDELDLPALGAVAALPALAGGLDLPDLAHGAGLPALGGSGGSRGAGATLTSSGSDDLPSLSDVGLPDFAGASLPALGGAELPTPVGAGLPALGGAALPTAVGAGLPALGGVGLPVVGGIGLPGSLDHGAGAFGSLPAPADEFDLPPPGGTDPDISAGDFGDIESLRAPLGLSGVEDFGAFGGGAFAGSPSITEAAATVDPFAASVPAPPPSGPPPRGSGPPLRAEDAPIVRQIDGGTGYGEVNLGGDDFGDEAPIEATESRSTEDDGPDDMEFGGVPQEDAKPATGDAALHARMAVGAKIAPVAADPKRRRRWPKYAIAALVLAVGGGGALSLTPFGPFGWYYLEGVLRGGEHQKLLDTSIAAARTGLATDTYPEARRALKESYTAHDAARRVPGIAAYSVLVAAMYELRFGADSEANARAKVMLEELADAQNVPHLELARAGNSAVTGQLARASSVIDRLARRHPRDIDVLVLRGEIALLGTKPGEAVAAWRAAAEVEPSARTAFGLARASFADKKSAEAEQHARRALELSPTHVGARILLARIAWTVGEDEAAAMKLLDEAAQKPDAASLPEQVMLNTLSGDIHLERSRISLAEAAFGRALKLDTKAAGALRGLGEALFQAGRFSEALARFEAGTKADPDLLEVQVGVAKTLLALERFDDARPMLVKLNEKHAQSLEVAFWYGSVLDAMGKRDEAEAAYRRAIANGPNDPRAVNAYTKLALLLGGKGDTAAARALLDEAGKKLPRSPAMFKALGELALQQGGYDDALAQFHKARELAPHDMGVLFSIGVTQRRKRDFEAALDTFDKVAESDRDYPGLALERGLVFEAAGRTEDALKAYEAALAKAPDDIDLKMRVGCGKAASGRAADAEKQLREVLDERPASAETNHCLGRAILAKGSDVSLALRHLERASELDPHRAEYHLYVGLAALEAGRTAQAEVALKRALELDQSLADAYWQRGVLRYRQGRVKDAAADLQRALELRPTRYEAHAALAEAYLDLQQEDRALGEWNKAIEMEPDNALWRFRYGKLLSARTQNDGAQVQLAKAVELAERAKPPPAWLWEAHMLLARALGQSPGAVPHWVEFLRRCPHDNPYRGEAKATLQRLGAPWDGD